MLIGGLDADLDGNFTWISDEAWSYEGRDANLSNRVHHHFDFSDLDRGLDKLNLIGDASFYRIKLYRLTLIINAFVWCLL